MRVAVERATIPVCAYNVTSSNNVVECETYRLDQSNTQAIYTFSGTIATGYYTATQLVSAINTELTSLFSAYTSYFVITNPLVMSYNSLTNRMIMTNNAFNQTPASGYYGTVGFRLTNYSGNAVWVSSLCHLSTSVDALFPTTSSVSVAPLTTTAPTLTSTQGVNIQPTSNYWIALSQMSSQVETSHNSFPQVIARIPVSVEYLATIFFEPYELFWIEMRSTAISQIQITIFDDAGKIVDMDNQPWTLTLYIDFAYLSRTEPTGEDYLKTTILQSAPNLADPLLRRDDFLRQLKRFRM